MYLHGLTSITPGQPGAGHGFPCCFLLALSHMAGLIATRRPEGSEHLRKKSLESLIRIKFSKSKSLILKVLKLDYFLVLLYKWKNLQPSSHKRKGPPIQN